ncbi:MAG: hypothetical protein R2941_23460 [Desulfobacterales bacterium]
MNLFQAIIHRVVQISVRAVFVTGRRKRFGETVKRRRFGQMQLIKIGVNDFFEKFVFRIKLNLGLGIAFGMKNAAFGSGAGSSSDVGISVSFRPEIRCNSVLLPWQAAPATPIFTVSRLNRRIKIGKRGLKRTSS